METSERLMGSFALISCIFVVYWYRFSVVVIILSFSLKILEAFAQHSIQR